VSTGYGLRFLWRWTGGGRASGGTPEVQWRVGAKPMRVHVKAYRPVTIVFMRPDANPATESVCFPDLGILAMVTPGARTAVEIGPRPPGRYEFHAPERDVTGWLIVEP